MRSTGRLRDIGGLKPIYFVPREDIASAVLIPSLTRASSVDCMVGFFSGQSLSMLAPGLASFIKNGNEPLRLVICPVLAPADRDAITKGYESAAAVVEDFLSQGLSIEDGLARHTLRCLAYLIGVGRLEIRIALMRDALFHSKVWLITDGTDSIAVHGSGNLTVAGLAKNYEQISVTKSWVYEDGKYTTDQFRSEFDAFWMRNVPECTVLDFPEALTKRLLRDYSGTRPPTEEELLALVDDKKVESPRTAYRPEFIVPDGLNYTSGDFAHQGRAADALENAGFRGILEMATGSGKTITAMVGAHKLFKEVNKLLIVVAAPYLPLISQWCEEIEAFGLKPANLSLVAGAKARNSELASVARRVRMSTTAAAEAVVITHNTLCDESFQSALERTDVPVLLIADEVHNLGRHEFISKPPNGISYRLGLSATPVRQYDMEGTLALQEYFGPVVFSFTLEQAIGVCLVPYDYHVYPVELTEDELDDWSELTERIKKDWWKINSADSKDATYIQTLLQRRRLILESAEMKMRKLVQLLEADRTLEHTLIYATDKDPVQLQTVNQILRDRGVPFHELTAEESSDRALTYRILKAFQRGDLKVLTAKRVLDEGVNIPQISKAFVLASTTVERQWVQRRGRLLRKCPATNKTFSTIHDFLVIPPNTSPDEDTKSIVRGELKRVSEFSRLSRNFGSADGALKVIDPIVKRYFTDVTETYASR